MSLQRRGKYNCSLVFLDDIGPMIQDVHKLVPYDKNLTSILHLRLSHSQGKDGFWKRLKTEIRDDETLKQKKANWKGEKFLNSVARIFSSEIADFSPIYRQIRQLFGPKSRKIRQFLAIYSGEIDPLSPKFRFLLDFYALIFSEFKILKNF